MINKRSNKYNIRLIVDDKENYYFEEYIKNDYTNDNDVRDLNTYLIKQNKPDKPDNSIYTNTCLLD